MENQEIKEAKLEGYKKALEDFAQKGKLNIETYNAELQLPKIEDKKKSDWWDKNFQIIFQAITAGLVAIIVALFGWQTSCRQNSQKDTEIAIKKVETVKELIPNLIEKDSEKRRYAFTTVLLLYSSPEEEKDKKSLFSFGETAYSLQDAQALEAVIKNIRNFGTINEKEIALLSKFEKKAVEIYSLDARKKRYEISVIDEKIKEKETEIKTINNDKDKEAKENELTLLNKNRETLFVEAKRDAENAYNLDSNNATALYDLTRFIQNNEFDSAKRLDAVKNFEKIIEMLSGKDEQSHEYLYSNLNLTILYNELENNEKAKCYSAQTIEKFKAKSEDELERLFTKEKEFYEISNKVNPNRDTKHSDCSKNSN